MPNGFIRTPSPPTPSPFPFPPIVIPLPLPGGQRNPDGTIICDPNWSDLTRTIMRCRDPQPTTTVVIPTPTPSVNQTINILNTGIDTIAAEIGHALTSSLAIANKTQEDISHAIIDAVGGLTSSIFGGVKDVFGQLGDWLKNGVKDIVAHLGDILGGIFNNLGALIKEVGKNLESILSRVVEVVDKITATIQEINDKFIQPIATLITDTMKIVNTLIDVIGKDLHDGLKGIVNIPRDIADGLGSLDATMKRTTEQLGTLNQKTAVDVLIGNSGGAVGDHLKVLGDNIGRATAGGKIDVTYQDFVKLFDHCELPNTRGVLDALGKEWEKAPEFAKWLANGALYVLSFALQSAGSLEIMYETAEENARATCPIKKLAPGDALQALRRGFISEEAATDELLKQGISRERMRILRDLGKQLIDANTLVDYWYRQIITHDELVHGLKLLAYTDDQIRALETGSAQLYNPSVALHNYFEGDINRVELDAILHANRFNDAQIQGLLDDIMHPAPATDALEGDLNRVLFGVLNLPLDVADSRVNNAIADIRRDFQVDAPAGLEHLYTFVRSAIAEHLEDSAIRQKWFAHWNTLNVATWIQLYFRGIRTKTELQHVMDRHHIPRALQNDVIESQRALIPFRTIPAMVAAGTIDEQYALRQLQGHGYDLTAANALLNYALQRTKTVKKDTAKAIHELSIATAKKFWIDGALTEEQYKTVLAAHGLDVATIDLTIRAETLAEHAKDRKELAQDIANEAIVGLISYEQAQQQLAHNNYTIAEQAKYLKQLRTQKKANEKLPTESELHRFLFHGIIDIDTYKEGVTALGFASKWVDAFAALRGGEPNGEPVQP